MAGAFHSIQQSLPKGGRERSRGPSQHRYEIESLEKRGYINSPLSPDLLLANFLGIGTRLIAFNSGNYNINFDLNARLPGAKIIINAGANVTFTSSETLASLTPNGGTASFTAATNYMLGCDPKTIQQGREELEQSTEDSAVGRVRKKGWMPAADRRLPAGASSNNCSRSTGT